LKVGANMEIRLHEIRHGRIWMTVRNADAGEYVLSFEVLICTESTRIFENVPASQQVDRLMGDVPSVARGG